MKIWEPRRMTADDVRSLLAGLGLTQHEFADQLGVSLNTVSRWATGTTEIPVWLADYVDVLSTLGHRGLPEKACQLSSAEFRAVLQELGWTQAYLGRRVAVVKSTVFRWMSGEFVVPMWVCAYLKPMLELRRIAMRLGVAG
jgi:transcriptional regulator with XRE-family HTH domain